MTPQPGAAPPGQSGAERMPLPMATWTPSLPECLVLGSGLHFRILCLRARPLLLQSCFWQQDGCFQYILCSNTSIICGLSPSISSSSNATQACNTWMVLTAQSWWIYHSANYVLEVKLLPEQPWGLLTIRILEITFQRQLGTSFLNEEADVRVCVTMTKPQTLSSTTVVWLLHCWRICRVSLLWILGNTEVRGVEFFLHLLQYLSKLKHWCADAFIQVSRITLSFFYFFNLIANFCLLYFLPTYILKVYS